MVLTIFDLQHFFPYYGTVPSCFIGISDTDTLHSTMFLTFEVTLGCGTGCHAVWVMDGWNDILSTQIAAISCLKYVKFINETNGMCM